MKRMLLCVALTMACLHTHALVNKILRFQVSNGINSDETLLGFYPNATDDKDNYDSYKYSNGDATIPELFFPVGGEEMVINGVPELLVNKSIALGFRTLSSGTFSIRWKESLNMGSGIRVFLKDNVLNTEQELTLDNSYAFTSAAITTSTRFTLFISRTLAKVSASDRSDADRLGSSVSVSGNWAVTGNNPSDSIGAVYVCYRNNSGWSQVQKLTSTDRTTNDHYGRSVALCNQWLLVGAPGKENNTGAAYLYRNDAGTWTPVQKITAPDASTGALFGTAVSLSGQQLVVSAPGDDAGSGAAYVFQCVAGSWSFVQKLTSSDKSAGDGFGQSVSLFGDKLLIGAPDEDEDAAGGNTFNAAGSAYLFLKTGETWAQSQKLVASDRALNDRFGSSLSLSGETAVVGAALEDEDAAGGNTKSEAGAAYVFKSTAGTWAQSQKLVAVDRAANDHFGRSVALSGNFMLIGAPDDAQDARGNDSLVSAGSAYLFKFEAGNWTQHQKINASDREALDRFGTSVAFSGKNGVVGIPYDNQDASGSNSLNASGSVAFFQYNPPIRTWNGSSWGIQPTALDSAVVNGTYNGAGFSCLDLVVNAGKKCSINSALTVFGNLTLKSNASSGTASFMDNGNTVFAANGVNVEQFLTGAGGSTPTGRFWYLTTCLSDAGNLTFDLSSTNPLNKFWTFSEPTVSYSLHSDRQSLTPGIGFVVRLGADKTVVSNGNSLATGDQSIPVTRTGSSQPKRGFNLVGNPYPSYVELDTADNPDMERTLWFRSLTSGGSSMVFDTYNLTSGASVVASGSGVLSSYIAPMQAFWVRKSTEGSGNLVFRNAKRSQQTGVSLRSSVQENLRLQLSNGLFSDETYIGFYPSASITYDVFDSHKLSNENPAVPELYTLAGSDELAINGLPSDSMELELPLGIRIGRSGTHTLSVQQSNLGVRLMDHLLDSVQDLNENPVYTFQTAATDDHQRFSLLLTKSPNALRTASAGTFKAWVGADRCIHLHTEGLSGDARFVLVDCQGRNHRLDVEPLQPGIYFVQMHSTTASTVEKVRVGL